MSTAPPAPPRPAPAPPRPARSGVRRPSPRTLLVLAVALGVVARLHTSSALWLDESLSLGIARRDLPDLLSALRQDGSPPVYYLLLHAWSGVLGTSATAVRALSTVLSLAALPLAWATARRLGGPAAGRAALLLLATSPFAVRYATETRMYALVQLLALAGLLAVLRALERPSLGRLAPMPVLAGLLALTHYWALFLLAAAAGVLLALARRGPEAGRRPARRVLAAQAAGAVLFVPWLPTFAFQVRRTGTPWAQSPKLVDAYYTVTGWAGGGSGPAVVLTMLLLALVVLAVAGHRREGGVALGRPLDRTGALLFAVAGGTLALGLVTGMVVQAGYAVRYSSVALPLGLVLAGLGVRALPPRVAGAALALAATTGLVLSLPMLTSRSRTQAAVNARVLAAALQPGDVVAYCPDQLGPAVSRLLPPGTDQVVYPTGASPELVDWVDYAQRNRDASPAVFAAELASRTTGAVWLVWAGGYRTFGDDCEALAAQLALVRGPGVLVKGRSGTFEEQSAVTRYPPTVAR